MRIQLNTDNHVTGSDDLALRLDAHLRAALSRFEERLTRVEAHFNDANAAKAGTGKRCQLEARVAGRQPLSVDHTAETIALALHGASDKLVRALDRTFGKQDADRHRKLEAPDIGAA
jgi:ribosome-associated translation inhibitor RaiA